MWTSHLVKPDHNIRLMDAKADVPKDYQGAKAEISKRLEGLREDLRGYQELLSAQGKHRLLIILQAMDTGGKDGTIRYVFGGVNPQGVSVTRFGVPSQEELAHDYLWRVHQHTPGKGHVMIFNRSHYEDVVTVGVKKLVPDKVLRQRYQQINDFERMLAEEGVTVLKFFLHISKEEQKRRIQERLKDPKKHWKFTLSDMQSHKRWSVYMKYYEEAISRTSTAWAPWCIVPADKNWYRNLVVAESIVDHLKQFKMRYPKLKLNPNKVSF